MAAIDVTAAQVSPVNENQYEGETYIAAAAIEKGEAYAIDSGGKAVLADASTGAANNVRGICIIAAGIGYPMTGVKTGSVYGFDLADLAYDDPVYLSNTAGGLDTAAGDVSLVVGRVKPMHDGATPTKVLDVNIRAIM